MLGVRLGDVIPGCGERGQLVREALPVRGDGDVGHEDLTRPLLQPDLEELTPACRRIARVLAHARERYVHLLIVVSLAVRADAARQDLPVRELDLHHDRFRAVPSLHHRAERLGLISEAELDRAHLAIPRVRARGTVPGIHVRAGVWAVGV